MSDEPLPYGNNTVAIYVDRALLDLIKYEWGQPLEISTDGRSLSFSPVRDTRRRMQLDNALRRASYRYAKALERMGGE